MEIISAEEIIEALDLKPLGEEGGYYRETYRSDEVSKKDALPQRYAGERAHSTCIYYFLKRGVFSAIHRILSDEIFHFYAGSPVEVLQLFPERQSAVTVLGPDILTRQKPQLIIPRGTWFGAALMEGGAWALMGTTVAPGFDFSDYEHGDRDSLIKMYPDRKEWIMKLTV